MMSPKDELVKLFNGLWDFLGVDHLLGTILLCFLFSLLTVKNIKNWKNVSNFQKTMDFAIWFALGVGLITLLIKTIRGE